MEYDEASIEEVDKIVKLGHPTTKAPAYFAWLVTAFVWAIGIYGLYQAISGNLALIGAILLGIGVVISKIYLLIILYSVLIFTIAIIGSFLLLYLVKIAARVVLFFIFIIIPVSLLAMGGFLFITGLIYPSLLTIAIGFLGLFLLIFFRKRLSLAGRAMQLSAQAVLDEKGTILAMFIASIFGMLTFLFLSFASTYVGNLIYIYTNNSDYGLIAGGITFFLGSWSIAFVSYLMNGTIAGIIHDWYRSPSVDVASFKKGLNRALKVQGGIALYALLMVTLRFIVEYARSRARRRGAIGEVILAGVVGFIGNIIRFITIYSIPAMVIRETGFKEGIKDSWDKLKKLFIETLASSFGFGYVIAVFGILITIFYGAIGYLLGIYVIFPIVTSYIIVDQFIIGVISSISFILIGLIPTILIFNTIGIAFITILYEFGLDIEFSQKGIKLPRRLPEDMEREFKELLAQRGIVIK